MQRIFLDVAPEQYAEVEASGACWDEEAKCWYVPSDAAADFSHWLERAESEAEFALVSDDAYVASARAACLECGEPHEVICLYCTSGTDIALEQTLRPFTVSNVWAMDAALAAQLEPWPHFRRAAGADAEQGCFVNHCPHCGAPQEDYRLHDEPGDVFFGLARAEPGSIQLTPLTGRIQLSGDYSMAL